jgi:N-acetylmuramoyl-L-alanine amidase
MNLKALALAALLVLPSSAFAQGAACDPAAFRVAVDVGHTAEVPGATSARGVPEYVFNLRLAQRIEARLRAAGFTGTRLLVTSGRSLAALGDRVREANALGADLFLSIHHDSVPEQFLESWEHEGVERHYSDRFRGHSLFVSHENAQAAASLRFAQKLGAGLRTRGLTYTPHYAEPFMGWRQRALLDGANGVYRWDRLHVLRRAAMPAVLFEAGSIVHRDEELLLGTPAHQETIAAAVAEATTNFCALRAGEAKARSRKRRTADAG